MITDPTRIRFGGDYNPEQFDESVWLDDVRLMREAGVDLVNVGIFSWSRIQRAEGEFDFDWLDRVLELLHGHGIRVGLATGTASPPPWAHTRYPGILPIDERGTVISPGSRQHYSASSPDFRRLAAALTTAVAERYATHPAVDYWHIGNEPACHVSVDYSDAAAAGFRVWLERRYGDLDALNHAWGGAFWSQLYRAWDEVLPPRHAAHFRNPAQLLDFRRFSSDALLECYVMERDILRAHGATQPATTNVIGPWATLDLWRWAREMDFISDDSYPEFDDPEGYRENALHSDLSRGLAGGRPWHRMESAPNPAHWRASPVPAAPGRVRALAWQAIGRGADGIQFFQWRQSPAGAEKYHTGMVPHTGTDTRSWREIVRLGTELAQTPPPPTATSSAPVALVIDYEVWWALDDRDLRVDLDYAAIVRRWYAALHAVHVGIDIVPTGGDLTGYRLIVAPQVYLLDDTAAAGFVAAAEAGATVLVGAFSDVVDETVRFKPGGFLTRLGEMLGVRVEEQCGLPSPTSGLELPRLVLDGVEYPGSGLVDVVQPRGAEVVAVLSGNRFDGDPGLTRHPFGAGEGWYLTTVPDAAGTRAVTRRLLRAAGIDPLLPGLPDSVDVARRDDVLTVVNHGEACTVTIDAPAPGGTEPLGDVTLEPMQVLLVQAAAR